jgi:DedD protein
MGLLSSLFKRKAAADSAARPAARSVSESAGDVQQLRLRARRRLIGAAVLVGIGVIGFPLVFETQPRPIPVDLPIDIPRKESAAPLAIPAPARPSLPASLPPAAEPAPRAAEPVNEPVTQPPMDVAAVQVPEPKPEPRQEARKEVPAAPVAKDGRDANKEAARVQALLEGKKPASAATGGRFIVQVGAYADNKAAHEARMKVERMGLRTYTQAVETADGKRIRVRVGPFASRDEADKVAAKVRGGGLSTAVLTL